MKLYSLFESNVVDVATKGFKTFLNDYKNSSDTNLFVVFSDSKTSEFKESGVKPYTSAMIAFPIKYVIDNAVRFANTRSKYVCVIKVAGHGVDVDDISDSYIREIMSSVLFTTGELKYHKDNHDKTLADAKKKYGPSYKGILFRDLLPAVSYRNRPDYVYSSNAGTMSILSRKHGSILFLLNRFAFKYITHYYNDNNPESASRSSITTRKLAAYVASGLGSVLSSDKEIIIFTESLFWTNDGIGISITRLFTNQSNKEAATNDGTFYIIECDTPNGVLIYNTTPTETFEEIKTAIAERVVSLNRPSGTWKPMSRDIYLTGSRFGFKALDEDKSKFLDTIAKFYPKMRDYALRNNITLPNINVFSDIDKIMIFNIMDNFLAKQDQPLVAIKRLKEDGVKVSELVDIDGIINSELIDYNLIERMALVYTAARKINPNRSGWHIFNYV